MITTYNIRTLWMPLYNWWMNNVGGGKHPEHIYYFRDGVSEGQYMHVLEQEVKDMKKCLAQKYGETILVRLFPSFEMYLCSQICRRMSSLR
jgi:eukaryotic translation initiation factor 2C